MIQFSIPGFCGEGLYFSYSSSALIIAVLSLIIGVFWGFRSLKSRSERIAAIGILASVFGLYGASDLFTNYICFEIAGFLAVFWMIDRTDSKKIYHVERYLGWQVITGMIMTMGMFLIYHYAGTMEYEELVEMNFYHKSIYGFWYEAAVACYIIGYGSRSALFLLHSWIDSVYSENSLEKGVLFSTIIMPGGIWSLKQFFLCMYSPLESWNSRMDPWESMTQFVIVCGILTIVLGLYRIWCCREKEKLYGDITMIISGVLFVLIMLMPGSELMIVGYIVIVFAAYFLVRKINWKSLHSLDLEWFSAERMVYEPLFVHALPFLLGVIFRILDYLPDSIVAWLRGTVYQDSKQRVWDKVGTPSTYILGNLLDEIVSILNKTFLRKRPIQTSFVNATAVVRKEWDTTIKIITGSVSFGLLMFSVGMIIVVIYIMV